MPPTPPGSSGCEVPSGRLPLVPLTSGISGAEVPPPRPGMAAGRSRHHLGHCVTVKAKYMTLGRFSGSKYNSIRPKGPPGTIFWLKIQFYSSKRPLRDAFPAQNTILSAQKAPAGRPSVIPKAKYMTLGPKFFCCSKMAVTRRRKHLSQE